MFEGGYKNNISEKSFDNVKYRIHKSIYNFEINGILLKEN